MPIYEFYCASCHTVFNFLYRNIDTQSRPSCPRCKRPHLERRVSGFAIAKHRSETSETPVGDVDDSRLEEAMASMASEADGLDDANPQQVAGLMRRLHRTAGVDLDPGMSEALRRMEAGEDPDVIEEELGDVLGQKPPIEGSGRRHAAVRRTLIPAAVDPELHEP